MSSAAFVSLQCTFENAFGNWKHVLNSLREDDILVSPAPSVRQSAHRSPLAQLADFFIRFGQLLVFPNDSRSSGHDVAQLLVDQIRVFVTRGIGKELFMASFVRGDRFFVKALRQIARGPISLYPIDNPWTHKQTAENAA